MTKPTLDFQGHPVTIGDTVIFPGIATFDSDRTGLRQGIITRIVYNPFDPTATRTEPIYMVLDLGKPSAKAATCSPKDIMYVNSDYRGMSVDYIRGLHGKVAE